MGLEPGYASFPGDPAIHQRIDVCDVGHIAGAHPLPLVETDPLPRLDGPGLWVRDDCSNEAPDGLDFPEIRTLTLHLTTASRLVVERKGWDIYRV